MHFGINSPLWRAGIGKMLRSPEANHFPNVIGTFMGRDALSLAVSILELDADDIVLLPAYLCREVLKPFLGKTRIELYDVRKDLVVDLEEIQLRLAHNKIKVLIIINYFGFLQPYLKEIKQICLDRGVILIEDCAHSLLTEGSGETGNLAIFSFRKNLPLPDGGGLRVNINSTTIIPDFYPQIYSNILSMLIFMKALFNFRTKIFSRSGLSPQTKNVASETSKAVLSKRFLPMSSFSRNGIGNVSFSEIIDKSRLDFQYWLNFTRSTDVLKPVFSNLPPGVCPLAFPVKIKTRELLKSRLEEKGIYLKIYWDLPSQVGREFVNSHELSRQVFTLPVYPELNPKDRERIARLLALELRDIAHNNASDY